MAELNGSKRSRNFKDITGLVVGRLTVVRFSRINNSGRASWICVCQCGNEREVRSEKLLDKKRPTSSCGCYAKEVSAKNGRETHTHQKSHSPEYYSWQGMKRRCEDEGVRGYERYGGRGIKVCDRWRNSFEAFYEDMGPKPGKTHTIDRIDNDGNYEPGNCQWATKKTQSRNTRTNVFVTYQGRVVSFVELCEISGKSRSTIKNRLNRGWSIEDAVSKPVDLKKSRGRNANV